MKKHLEARAGIILSLRVDSGGLDVAMQMHMAGQL
jgi:hypothetical protein